MRILEGSAKLHIFDRRPTMLLGHLFRLAFQGSYWCQEDVSSQQKPIRRQVFRIR